MNKVFLIALTLMSSAVLAKETRPKKTKVAPPVKMVPTSRPAAPTSTPAPAPKPVSEVFKPVPRPPLSVETLTCQVGRGTYRFVLPSRAFDIMSALKAGQMDGVTITSYFYAEVRRPISPGVPHSQAQVFGGANKNYKPLIQYGRYVSPSRDGLSYWFEIDDGPVHLWLEADEGFNHFYSKKRRFMVEQVWDYPPVDTNLNELTVTCERSRGMQIEAPLAD